ncbi:flagellar hook-associated protein 2 [Pseudalkalibacillus salsuginis]|uniref:flagellar hook-associated protein 2 n=1 Tax=Pseudalkalibacillus salsuginis TaxID=2910972 RepID=UPI001F23F35E|nr:flagellar hook-associated protein 2 [Pseudalkalibacillus salsuginis]MCF6410155.1 flagellar hook-associated protein 2 [Pseudalkalibacillus salsuginis]
MRIGGLASGMDIDQIVKDLMRAERIPLDKMNQDRQLLEWKRDDYREMNKLLKDLDQLIFDGIYRQKTYLTKSTASSNEAVVSATAGSNAAATTTTIDVTRLASAARYNSETAVIDPASGDDGDTLLQDVDFNTAGSFAAPFSLKLSVIKPGESLASDITLDIDPSTDSINDIMSKINSHTSLGVSAFYDEATNKVVLTMKNTGSGAKLSITDDGSADSTKTAEFFSSLGFTNASAGNELGDSNGDGTVELTMKTVGQDAEFTYNGYATTRKTNTFTINDVTYNLKQVGSANVSVTQNTDSIFDSIVKFVDKYNETIEKINGEIGETRYRSYLPLTKEQREDMGDREVELWEEKAKSGMLRGDTILSGGLNAMRSGLYSQVTGANVSSNYNQLAQIGIKTSSNYRDGGKLIIDPDKLKKAIQDDPNAVYQLFMSKGETTSEQGIARRLRESISDTMTKIEVRAGNSLKTNQQFSLGRNMTDLDSRISNFERKLIGIEDRYWSQFTAMEKAISRMNQQSMFLMNQFGGGM